MMYEQFVNVNIYS